MIPLLNVVYSLCLRIGDIQARHLRFFFVFVAWTWAILVKTDFPKRMNKRASELVTNYLICEDRQR